VPHVGIGLAKRGGRYGAEAPHGSEIFHRVLLRVYRPRRGRWTRGDCGVGGAGRKTGESTLMSPSFSDSVPWLGPHGKAVAGNITTGQNWVTAV